jgi:DNA polymerase-1
MASVLEFNEKSKETFIEEFLVDVRSYIHNYGNIKPNAEFFSKENLSKLPAMGWLRDVKTELIYPVTRDTEEQRSVLLKFKERIKLECIRLPKGFCSVFPEGYNEPLIALDIEATGLDLRCRYDYDGNLIIATKLVGFSIATSENESYYFPVLHTEEDGVFNWDKKVILEFLDQIHQEFAVIYHNAQYDREGLALNGVKGLRPWPYFFDTMLLDFMQDVNDKVHGLKPKSVKILNRQMILIEDLFNSYMEDTDSKKRVNKKDLIMFDKLPAINATVYGCSDVLNTFGLFKHYAAKSTEENSFGIQPIPVSVDHKMVDVFRNMYRPGLPVNLDYFILASKDVLFRMEMLKKNMYELVGEKFDIGSPKQLSIILFDKFNLPVLDNMKKGKSGYYSTKEEVLDKLYEKYPDYDILRFVVTYRKLQSALSKVFFKCIANSFVDARLPYTKVQLSFSTTVIPTGRCSSNCGKSSQKDRVVVQQKKTKITYNYQKEKGWMAGFNAQGVPNDPYIEAKAKKIKKLPDSAGFKLGNMYPIEVGESFIKEIVKI